MDGIRFLNKVAEMAEAADHHSDVMKIEYTRITFSYSTHDQGPRDREGFQASQIEEAFETESVLTQQILGSDRRHNALPNHKRIW